MKLVRQRRTPTSPPAVSRAVLAETAQSLVAELGLRQGLRARAIYDTGEVPGQFDARRAVFERIMGDAIRRLKYDYGRPSDPDALRTIGVDPEVVVGPPPGEHTDARLVALTAWITRDTWLFRAGRTYRRGRKCRAQLVLGVAREGKEMAVTRLVLRHSEPGDLGA